MSLELSVNGMRTKSYLLERLFVSVGARVETIVAILDPRSLRGTAFRMSEQENDSGVEVDLYLPAGSKEVLHLRSSLLKEGLLGSDFSYEDMAWKLPMGSYEFLGYGNEGGRSTVKLLYGARTEGTVNSQEIAVLYFDPAGSVLVKKELFRSREDFERGVEPYKVLRVTGSRCLNGVNTPTLIDSETATGLRSELKLQSVGTLAGDVFFEDGLASSFLPRILEAPTGPMKDVAPGQEEIVLCDQ